MSVERVLAKMEDCTNIVTNVSAVLNNLGVIVKCVTDVPFLIMTSADQLMR